MKEIFWWMGAPGVGKTTLCQIFLQELLQRKVPTGKEVLVIDAASRGQLAQEWLENIHTVKTLASLAEQLGSKGPFSTETIDWLFHDRTYKATPHPVEFLLLGPLPETLSSGAESTLWYGLERLLQAFDTVIIDGEHPFLNRHLPAAIIHPFWVVTPFQYHLLTQEESPGKTPMVFLNRYPESPFPPEFQISLDQSLEKGLIQMAGRFPEYPNLNLLEESLPLAFHHCLPRLDLPIGFSQTTF